MEVCESTLVTTFQGLIDQMNELYKITDTLRNDLNYFLLQKKGLIPASSIDPYIQPRHLTFQKEFKRFDVDNILFILDCGTVCKDKFMDTDQYNIITTDTMILLRHAQGRSFDFRDAIKCISALWSSNTKMISMYNVPNKLLPVQECWMQHGHDLEAYETEFLKLIKIKKTDLEFKMAFSDMEHNNRYITVPEAMFQKAITFYWELN